MKCQPFSLIYTFGTVGLCPTFLWYGPRRSTLNRWSLAIESRGPLAPGMATNHAKLAQPFPEVQGMSCPTQ